MRFSVVVQVLAVLSGVVWSVSAQPSGAPKPAAAAQAPPGGKRPAPAKGRTEKVELTDEAELAKVVGLYEAGKYSECAGGLKPLLDPKSISRLRERNVIENARIYLAACLIGSGKPEAADEPLRAAIRENMQMTPPDSLLFPPPVVDRFLQVRQSLYDEIRRAEAERLRKAREDVERRLDRERVEMERMLELERLASRELVVTRNRRWVGFVPFGVGQFQNGNEGLGWVFLTSEAVLGATALTSLGVTTHFHSESNRMRNPDNNAVVDTWFTLFEVSSYSFLAVAALGIAEAQLSFVPEFSEVRSRPLPPKLRRPSGLSSLRPRIGAVPTGALFGLTGAF
jgi:hypothetical protein